MIDAIFRYAFMQNAVLSAILASIVCGIIGTMIIEKKMVMMSGGIAHTAFGGIGMGYFFNISPMFGALTVAVAASLGIAEINRRTHTNTDILIGLFWSMGMAAGILFIAFTPGYPPDMSTYLFGDILTVSRQDLWMMLILDGIVVMTVAALYQHYKAYLFDDEFASVLGVNTRFLEYLLFIITALTIVVLIRVVGFILVIALLTAPPATAKRFTSHLKGIMLLAILFSILYSMGGIWLSYQMNIPSGASIIMVSGVSYLAVAILTGLKYHREHIPGESG